VLSCLRATPADDLVLAFAALGLFDLQLLEGGRVLPRPILQLLRHAPDPVPLLIGGDRHERSVFGDFAGFVLGEEPYRRSNWVLDTNDLLGPELGPEVRRRYPAGAYGSPLWSAIDAFTDAGHVCPTRQIGLAATGPVWRFVYGHTFRNDDFLRRFRAGHIYEDLLLWPGADLVFSPNGPYVPTEREARFARGLVTYWTNFARTGDPNDGTLAFWPRFRATDERSLILDHPLRRTSGYHRSNCEFLDGRALFPELSEAEARVREAGDPAGR
jgi:para-nitrobenzyl esterase